MLGANAWMRANLTTQGYCLTDEERRRTPAKPIAT
jgi:hypothetical protein